jgi:endonuclease G
MFNTTFHKTIIYTFVFFCFAGFSSCKEKNGTKEVEVNLEILLTQDTFPNEGSTVWLRIETDPKNVWTVTVEADGNWISVTPATGVGSGSAIVSVSRNNSSTERLARITVAVGETERFVELSQEAVPAVVYEVPFRIELPLVRDSTWYIQHDVGMYAMEYDTGQRHAIWVAYVLNRTLLDGSIDRANFRFDPKIPRTLQPHEQSSGTEQLQSRYWTLYGYERGHLLASADRPFSQAANDETNYISNISPHLQEFHNSQGGMGSGQGVWLRLEGMIREWAKNCDTLYVVKGGSIIPGAPGTEIVEVLYDLNRTVVPRYYFKALVQRRGSEFEGIAFWLRQEKGMARRAVARTDVITIRELEERTGINFFHNLKYVFPGNPNLEEQVETNTPNWSWWSPL